MKNISVCIGTRPEAIKLAPLVLALKKRHDVRVSVCVTGQHTDMVFDVLKIFQIAPDINFSLMDKTDSLNDASAFLLKKFQTYFVEFKPDVVCVQGDTASVLIGALSAFNLQIPVAHIEAGLRTGNLASPWPEEGYRRMVTQFAKYHFAPTELSSKNIINSGITENISVVGNTVIDALNIGVSIIEKMEADLNIPSQVIMSDCVNRVLITGHRRENFGEGLDNLCTAIRVLAEKYIATDFIFPVHLNPTVQKQVKGFFQELNLHNVKLIEPQPYLEFIWLMKNSHFIITDSGGVQEEAPSLGKPVLVTRDTTERPEGVAAGTVKLVGTSSDSLIEYASKLFDDETFYKEMSIANNPYGGGDAVDKIVSKIMEN